MVARAAGTQPLLDPKDQGPRYDATKFNWIGTPQQEVGLLLVRQPSPIQTLARPEIRTESFSAARRLGRADVLLSADHEQAAGNEIQDRRRLQGLAGSVARARARRGRGAFVGQFIRALRERIAPWIKAGKVKILAQIGLEKDPEYPDVPLIIDLATTGDERQVLEVVFTQQAMAWPIVAPPGVPPSGSRRCAKPSTPPWPTRNSWPKRPGRSSRSIPVERREDRRLARPRLRHAEGPDRSRRRTGGDATDRHERSEF